MAWSVSSSTVGPKRSVEMVTRKRVAISSKTGGASPASRQAAVMRLHAAAPLLDQPEGVEDAPDHPIAQLRDAVVQVLDREAEGQEPRVLDLEAT